MAKSEKTSPKVASVASSILRSTGSTKAERSAAASALAQAGTAKVTAPWVASKAARVLDAPKASPASKSVGGSVLTQKTNGLPLVDSLLGGTGLTLLPRVPHPAHL